MRIIIPQFKQEPAGFIQAVLLAGALVFLISGFSVSAQDALTPQESRGKQIYVQGTSASGREILAYLGSSSIEVPGSAMPCANCHGLDGQGKPEGGVNPSDLRWESLTKPYGVANANGRKHPPYTERGIELALTRGTDPAGKKLLEVMPRYQMSPEDLSDLIAYMKRLGKDRDPGISEDKIVIGTVVPLQGGLMELGQAVKAATSAYFQELNSQGGIYNRKFEVKFTETGDTPAATRANVERFHNSHTHRHTSERISHPRTHWLGTHHDPQRQIIQAEAKRLRSDAPTRCAKKILAQCRRQTPQRRRE